MVLSIIAIVMTVGVYGLVAGIVKIDDAGLYLIQDLKHTILAKIKRSIGRFLLLFAPYLMKMLSVIGTIAMFMVGGGIISHGVTFLHHFIEKTTHLSTDILGNWVAFIMPSVLNCILGIIAGFVVVLIVSLITKIKSKL
jgi:predicted DNA repair protein MutK